MPATKLHVCEKAREIWEEMDEGERTVVRFGMFPMGIMTEAEAEGYNGRELSVALMECAENDGGMVA